MLVKIEIYCPVCKQKAHEVTQTDLRLGFRLTCTLCEFSVYMEDGHKQN